jgi:hypothetical protein
MSEHFGKCQTSDNMINLDEGPSRDNLFKELRYGEWFKNNPGEQLKKSASWNSFEGTSLGGDYNPLMTNGSDCDGSGGDLLDIHPCGESYKSSNSDGCGVIGNPDYYNFCKNGAVIDDRPDERRCESSCCPKEYFQENFMDSVKWDHMCLIILFLLAIAFGVYLYCNKGN